MGVVLCVARKVSEGVDAYHIHADRGELDLADSEVQDAVVDLSVQADAIANYSHLFRRSEGMYLTFPHEDTMEEDFLEQTKGRDIDLVVCSDAEAILGIGDQGVGGIGVRDPIVNEVSAKAR